MKKNRTLLFIFAFLSPLFIVGAVAAFQNYRQVADELYRQELYLNELSAERDVLKQKMEYFSSPSGIEREARGRLGLVREGERKVIFISPEIKPEPEALPKVEQTLFEKMLQWLRLR